MTRRVSAAARAIRLTGREVDDLVARLEARRDLRRQTFMDDDGGRFSDPRGASLLDAQLDQFEAGEPMRVPFGLMPRRVRALIGRWRMCLVYADGTVAPD